MRKLSYIGAAVFVVVLGLTAQEAPQLKPEVSLAIVKIQLQRSEGQTKLLVLQQQYQQTQEAVKAADTQLAEKLSTALKDSGLDPNKYMVDPQTLSVRMKPAGGTK